MAEEKEPKQSPIYNLSMCSLENFHTCFLKWLGNEYPEKTFKLLTGKGEQNIKFFTQENCGKYRFDLVAKDKYNKIIMVLENKLKSYPTTEQLYNYSEVLKSDKPKKILLSLVKPNFFDEKFDWEYKSYADLAEGLRTQNFQFKNDYHKFLVDDYVEFITELSERFKELPNTGKYDFYSVVDGKDKEKYKDIRDIYIKYRTDELRCSIEGKLKESTISAELKTDFRNKQGILDIRKTLQKEPEIVFLIQIQHNQYRYCMVGDGIKEAKKRLSLAQEIKNNDLWFFPTEKYKSHCSDKHFCEYKPCFIYNYEKLNDSITYKELFNKIKEDMQHLEDKKNDILNLISNNTSK